LRRGDARPPGDSGSREDLDAFAGEGLGIDRLTGEEFKGSARIALEVADPAFTRLRYFELPERAKSLEEELRKEYPGRDIRVYPGDCNDSIPQALADLSAVRWAPTFAFLDRDGMALRWGTRILVAVERKFASDHRSGSSGAVGSRKALRVPAGSWSSGKAYRPWSSMCSQISGVSR
jgi:hypothetical protein